MPKKYDKYHISPGKAVDNIVLQMILGRDLSILQPSNFVTEFFRINGDVADVNLKDYIEDQSSFPVNAIKNDGNLQNSTGRCTIKGIKGEAYQAEYFLSRNSKDTFFCTFVIEENRDNEINELSLPYDFIELSNLMVFIKDHKLRYLYASPSYCDFMGKKVEEIVGKTDFDILQKNAADICYSSDIQTLNSDKYIQTVEHLGNRVFVADKFKVELPNGKTGVGAVVINNELQKEERIKHDRLIRFLKKTNEYARIGYWEYNEDTNSLFWSDTVREIHEVDSSYIPEYKTAIAFYKEGAGRETLEKALKNTAQSGKPFDLQIKLVTAKNNELWVRIIGFSETDKDGSVVLYGTFQDINKEKVLRENLQKTKNLIKNISDQIPGVIFEFFYDGDRTLKFLFLSDGVKKLTGFGADELLADFKKAFKSIHPDDLIKIQKSLYKAHHSQSALTDEFRVFHPEKGIRWMRFYARTDVKRHLNTWYGVVLDVTDEVYLREQDKLMALVSAKTNNIIIVTDEQRKIEWVNESFTRITGYELAEVKGLSPGSLLQGEETNPNRVQEIRESLDKEYKYNGEILNYSKKGEKYWVHLVIQAVFDDDGKVVKYFSIQTDITEKKKQENALRKSEEKYRLITEHSSDGILIIDKGGINFASPGYERMTGYTQDELSRWEPQKIIDNIHPDDQVNLKDIIEQTLVNRNTSLRFIIRKRKKDGWFVSLENQAQIIYNSDGSIQKAYVNVRDVTNRLEAERKIRFQAHLLNQVGQAVIATSVDGNILYINEHAEALYGWTFAEIVGMNILDTEPAESKDLYQSLAAKVLEGETFTVEMQAQTKKGDKIPVSATLSPIWGDKNNVIGIISVSYDITEKIESQKQIKKLTKGIEQSPATIVITDTSARIEYVNPKFEEVTGYSFEEVKGKNPRLIKSGNLDAQIYNNLWNTITQGKDWRGEFQNKSKDGRIFWETATISPIKDESGNISNYIAVKEDITEKKEYEQYIAYLSKIQSVLTNIAKKFINLGVDQINDALKESLEIIGSLINVERIYLVNYDYNNNEASIFLEWLESKNVVNEDNLNKIPLHMVSKWNDDFLKDGVIIFDELNSDKKKKDILNLIQTDRQSFHILLPITHENVIYGFIGFDTFDTQRIFRDEEIDLMQLFARLLSNLKIKAIAEKELMESESKLRQTLDVVNEQNKKLLEFTSILSHNIRSHAANIKGIADIMNETDDPVELKNIHSLLQVASGELIETLSHLNQTMNIQRKRNPKKEPIELKKFVQKTLYSIRDQITSSNTDVIINISENQVINYNKGYLESIILNLSTNAVRYRHPERNPKLEIWSEIVADQSILHFKDNGLGLDLDEYGYRLFGMYQVFHENPESRGLGLFIVKNQVEAMGGEIKVKSKPGKGSLFSVYL